MRKLFVALTLLSTSLSTAAFAQAGRGTDSEQKACTRDVQKFCPLSKVLRASGTEVKEEWNVRAA